MQSFLSLFASAPVREDAEAVPDVLIICAKQDFVTFTPADCILHYCMSLSIEHTDSYAKNASWGLNSLYQAVRASRLAYLPLVF